MAAASESDSAAARRPGFGDSEPDSKPGGAGARRQRSESGATRLASLAGYAAGGPGTVTSGGGGLTVRVMVT